VYAAQTQWDAAYDFAEKAVKEMPDSVEAHFQLVACFMSDHQVEKTINYISNIDPYILADHPALYLTLAETQINADLLADAKRTVEKYRSVYPNNPNIMEYLDARILLKSGNAIEAASKLEVLLERAPEIRAARYALGIAYLESRELGKAKNTFELYLRNNPDDRRARVVWDSTFSERTAKDIETVAFGLLDSETPYFRSLISTANSLAKKLTGSDYDDDAERQQLMERLFERAITESPKAPDAYRDLGFFYLDQQNVKATRQLLERANEAGVGRLELNLLRAALALTESRPEHAQSLFEDETKVKTKEPNRILQWATLFAEKGYPLIATQLFDAAREEDPTPENRAELDLAQIDFYIQTGTSGSATALIESLSGNPAGIADFTTKLNDKRLAVSRLLMASDEPPEEVDVDQLISAVENTEPNRTDAKIVRVRLMLQQEPVDLASAFRLCDAARNAGATDVETYLVSSEIAYKTGLFDDALRFAIAAHEASPDNLSTNLALARMQLQTGFVSDAILTLEKVQSRLPENRATINLLARAYAGVGRFNDADKSIQRLEKLEGGQIQVSLRAWLLIARGNWADAEELLSAMHKGNLDDLWTIHFLVVAMENQEKWEEAENFLNECIIRRPELPDIWVELGNLYQRDPEIRDFSKSSHAYTKALTRQTGYSRAIRGLLDVQLRTKNLGAALALCNRLLISVPNDPTVLQQKSAILSQLPGRSDDALVAIQQAIDIKPEPTYFYFRGVIRLDKGDYTNAIEDFQRVDNVGGGGFDNIDLLMADAYLGLDNLDLARSYYEVAKSKVAQEKGVDSERMNRIKLRLLEESELK
jgi:tetratricopeptide (TPR) repeat protein